MHSTALVINLILGVIVAKSIDTSKSFQDVSEQPGARNVFGHKTFTASLERKHKALPKNMTYVDIPDNSMHVPLPPAENPTNRKKLKKTPKRTIQKIIKKGRAKRKFYVNRYAVPTSTGVPGTPEDSEEALSPKVDNKPTTTPPHTHRRKNKKWNDRTHQIPIHKLSSKREQKRMKRETDRRRDIFIIQDFDETEFLSKENGVDVANVHIKSYW